MKSFFKDYDKCWRVYWEFQKEHWLGMIIFTAVIVLIEFLIMFPGVIIDFFRTIEATFSVLKDRAKEKREKAKIKRATD